jgi:hypothetical protein
MSTQFSGVPVRPFKGPPVNAGTTVLVDYSCRNPANELEEPTAVRYRIDNITDVVVVQDWQNIVDPETEGSITISAELNGMSRQWRDRQLNQVTVEATFASGAKVVEIAAYQLCAVYTGQGGG